MLGAGPPESRKKMLKSLKSQLNDQMKKIEVGFVKSVTVLGGFGMVVKRISGIAYLKT